MAAIVQQLRTLDPSKLPATLEPGQVAFNLANDWMFVGLGNADIVADGTTLAAYGNTQTILGVNNVTVPAKPAAGKGYEIYKMTTTPYVAGVTGLTDLQVNTAAGADTNAKITTALLPAVPKSGDVVVLGAGAGSPFPGIELGSYIYDGSKWIITGGAVPDASTTTKGAVLIGRPTDFLPASDPTATVPDPLAIATAAQLKTVNSEILSLASGTDMLGTYDASGSAIATANHEATAGGRGALIAGGKLSAGTGLHSGDFFIVGTAGTITGEAAAIDVACNVGDILMYDGTNWGRLPTGPVLGGVTIHGASDVSDANVYAMPAADIKGLLVRDTQVADGAPNAYRLVSTIDLGLIP